MADARLATPRAPGAVTTTASAQNIWAFAPGSRRRARPDLRAPFATVLQHSLAAAAREPRIGRAGAPTQAGPVRRIDQRDPAEFDTPAQAQLWGPSACAAAALVMVLRARGGTATVADAVRALGPGWSPQRGLLGRQHLVRAAAQLGLSLSDRPMSLDELDRLTGAGIPVLVDVTGRRFPLGHWLVVTAVDATGVSVVDSSGDNLTRISRQEFLASWKGRGMVPAEWRAMAPAYQEHLKQV